MTRTAISSCKQFNKMCVCYPAVITNWYPSTPHKGVNGDIRHDYTGSLPSRQTSLLCKELGGDYPGPMGSAGNSRVQIRPDSNPSPGKQASCAVPQSNRPDPDNRGGTRTAGQTGHKGISTLPKQFYFPTFPGGKERGWAKTSGQSEGSKQFCALRALQDGRPPHSPGPNSDRGLYDQARSERCISPDPNPSGSPTSPISVDGENIPILMPSFRADLSSKGIHKGAKATNWNTPADRDSISGLPGRYPYPPSGQGGARESSPFDLQPFRSTGISDQHQEILTNSPTEHRIPGISDQVSDSANSDATGEAEENPARCQRIATTSISHCAGSSPFCGKNHSLMQGNLASSPTLQGNPSLDELSVTRGRRQPSPNRPVQYQASPIRGSTTGPSLVGITGSNCTVTSPPSTKSPLYDHHFRCLHHRLGGLFGGHNYRGVMVGTGDDAPHQLFRTSSCLPGSTMFSEDREQYNHSSEVGQRDSSHLHQPVGRNPLQTFMPTSTCLLGMVHSEELVSDCRTSSGSAECTGRPRIQEPEGSIRLDDQPPTASPDSRSVGSMSGRSICFSPDSAATQLLQLENRSGGRGSGCIQTGLVTLQGVCQSPLVFSPSLPQSSSCSEGQANTINPSVAIPSVVPSGVGGCWRTYLDSSQIKGTSSFSTQGRSFKCPNLVAWPISGNPSHHEEFLRKLQHSSYPPGDLRPSPVTTQHLLNGLAGVTSGTEIPLLAL